MHAVIYSHRRSSFHKTQLNVIIGCDSFDWILDYIRIFTHYTFTPIIFCVACLPHINSGTVYLHVHVCSNIGTLSGMHIFFRSNSRYLILFGMDIATCKSESAI